jgi:hypothetical protein
MFQIILTSYALKGIRKQNQLKFRAPSNQNYEHGDLNSRLNSGNVRYHSVQYLLS